MHLIEIDTPSEVQLLRFIAKISEIRSVYIGTAYNPPSSRLDTMINPSDMGHTVCLLLESGVIFNLTYPSRVLQDVIQIKESLVKHMPEEHWSRGFQGNELAGQLERQSKVEYEKIRRRREVLKEHNPFHETLPPWVDSAMLFLVVAGAPFTIMAWIVYSAFR